LVNCSPYCLLGEEYKEYDDFFDEEDIETGETDEVCNQELLHIRDELLQLKPPHNRK
jgi:hypothetical protein